uniref:Ubiquitin-protein ligase n=1 Tax=Solanum tuberosum TaxID=4113 RepID=M1A734_SOLTU
MVGREKIHFLINPTTLKHHQIPMFDSLLPLHRTCYMYGLGYDVVNDDYKVVVLSYPVKNKTVTCVYMYSVRKGLWEKLENSPYDHSPFEPRSGVLVNEALHWLTRTTSENSTTIAAFDLSVDKFSEEYGVKESWTKFKITVHVPLTTLLCSIGDDDVLLDADEELAVYNMKENRRKDLLIDVKPLFYEGRTFVDSLVSPYFGSETES